MNIKILELLEKNSKLSTSDIATFLKVSEEEVINAIAKMEEDKIICGYNTVINWDSVCDEKVTALIEVKVVPQRNMGYDKIAERIYNFDEVDSLYLVSGDYDFVVIIIGKSMKEVSKFVYEKLSTLELVNSASTHFVMKKYKDHGITLKEKTKGKRNNVIL